MNQKNRSALFTIILTVVLVFPLFIPVFYSVPKADEYGMANQIYTNRYEDGLDDLHIVFKITKRSWLEAQGTWGGTAFWTFLQCFGLGVTIDRIITTILLVVFIVSLILVSNEMAYLLSCDSKVLIILLTVFAMNAHIPSEALYWVCASQLYTLFYVLALLSIAFYLRYLRTDRMCLFVMSAVSVFLSTGGVLVITGFINIVMILLCGYAYHKKKRKAIFIPYIITFVGSAFNAFAPGNFIRNARFIGEESYSTIGLLIDAIVNTIKTGRDIGIELTMSFTIPAVIIAGVIIGLFYCNPMWSVKVPIAITISLSISVFTAIFPACLGYHGKIEGAYRIKYIVSSMCVISILLIVVSWTEFLKRKLNLNWIDKNKNLLIFMAGILVFVGFMLSVVFDSEVKFTSITIMHEWLNGDLANYRDFHLILFEQIRNGTSFEEIKILEWPNIKTLFCDIMDEGNYSALKRVIHTMQF